MNLLVVIPICHLDTNLAERLLTHCADPGDASHKFPALLVLSATLKDEVEKWRTLAEAAFASVDILLMDKEDNLGWPAAPNFMFRSATAYLGRTGNKLPWFWLEADSVPVTREWLEKIITEYNLAGKPYMGASEKTRMTDPSTGYFVKFDGTHINGSAIYPADFHRRSKLWRYAIVEAWDVYCRWEIAPHAHATDSMVSRWRSRKYSKRRGKIVYERNPAHPHDPDIPDAAQVIHGCKDMSLFDTLWPKPKKKRLNETATPNV